MIRKMGGKNRNGKYYEQMREEQPNRKKRALLQIG